VKIKFIQNIQLDENLKILQAENWNPFDVNSMNVSIGQAANHEISIPRYSKAVDLGGEAQKLAVD
jgi:hypothetical protein